MRYLYHATSIENLGSILIDGLHKSADGLVYLAETPLDAAKFIVVKGCKEILTVRVKILKKDEPNIIETFDHSYNFFKCRSFGSTVDIPTSKLSDYRTYII